MSINSSMRGSINHHVSSSASINHGGSSSTSSQPSLPGMPFEPDRLPQLAAYIGKYLKRKGKAHLAFTEFVLLLLLQHAAAIFQLSVIVQDEFLAALDEESAHCHRTKNKGTMRTALGHIPVLD